MVYSIKQKIDICLMSESNPDMTQHDLAKWAKDYYNTPKPPSQTTISRILSKKDELISLKQHELKLIRRRRLSNPLLRMVLLEWISQNVWNNIPITSPVIISTASNFWRLLPEGLKEGNGEFSYKWCQQFLSKVNINLNNIERELYHSRLKIWTFEERFKLKQLLFESGGSEFVNANLNSFDIKNIFTLSDFFVSYNIPLDKQHYTDNSDLISMMFCANIDGSEKLDPLIIGRYEDYPSFEGKPSLKLSGKYGITYHSNRKRWLTSTVFYDWLNVLDKRLALTNRHIIILLDDSASHRVVNLKLQRIRLLFTSSVMKFLPFDYGLENDFKILFRIQQYKALVERQKAVGGRVLTKEELRFTMLDTFRLVKESWYLMTHTRIQTYWKQSGILSDELQALYPRFKRFQQQNELELQLFDKIQEFKAQQQWEITDLLDLAIERKINETFLSNEEIIESCIVDNYPTGGSGLHFDKDKAPYSHSLGQSLQVLQRFGEVHQKMNQNPELYIQNNLQHLLNSGSTNPTRTFHVKDEDDDEDDDFDLSHLNPNLPANNNNINTAGNASSSYETGFPLPMSNFYYHNFDNSENTFLNNNNNSMAGDALTSTDYMNVLNMKTGFTPGSTTGTGAVPAAPAASTSMTPYPPLSNGVNTQPNIQPTGATISNNANLPFEEFLGATPFDTFDLVNTMNTPSVSTPEGFNFNNFMSSNAAQNTAANLALASSLSNNGIGMTNFDKKLICLNFFNLIMNDSNGVVDQLGLDFKETVNKVYQFYNSLPPSM